jgi:hypothetical protein
MKTARGLLPVALVCLGVVALGAQLKDTAIGSRPLTDADMEKYVAITKEVAKTSRALKGDTSPAAQQKMREATVEASEPHGWGSLDYSTVNTRVTAAQTLIKFEKQMTVPPDKKADVELVKTWKARIDVARKR